MALVKAKESADAIPVNYISPIAARIQQLRYCVLVTSLLYYEADYSLISDYEWSRRAKELVSAQKENPEVAASVIFADAFKDFEGDTGYHLPYKDAQIVRQALRLVRDSDVISKLQMIEPISEEWLVYKNKKHVEPIKEDKKVEIKRSQVARKTLFGNSRK